MRSAHQQFQCARLDKEGRSPNPKIISHEQMSGIIRKPQTVRMKNSSKLQKLKFITGPNFRSKTGCDTCRHRRRKCDETEPICDFCASRGLECVYKSKPDKNPIWNTGGITGFKSKSTKSKPHQVTQQATNIKIENEESNAGNVNVKSEHLEISPNIESVHERENREPHVNPKNDFHESLESAYNEMPESKSLVISSRRKHDTKGESFLLSWFNSPAPEIPKSSFSEYDFPIDIKDSFIFSGHKLDSSPNAIVPSSLPSLCLDDKGIHYLDYFHNRVSKILAICFDNNKNYFKRLFYLLANNEETFTYVVVAWGALYCKDRLFDEEATSYLNKGLKKFNELFAGKINEFDYYFQFCFYLILSEMHICIGETRLWRVYFENTIDLINEYGGLEKICKDFGYSHEIRFMISNLQYNDIMSSKSLICGTRIPTDVYERVFGHESFKKYELSYGIDTLQGCHQPVLLLLGEIMTNKAVINSKLSELKSCGDLDSSRYFEMKREYFNLVEEISSKLNSKIEQVEPNMQLLNSIRDCLTDYDIYFHTYRLYKIICRFYWFLYIKQITPDNYQVQHLLMDAFQLIDYLMTTKMNVILCLPLLVCACCVYEDNDKQFIESRVEKVKLLSPVKNLDKCWQIISRVWELNKKGNVIVDWSIICVEFGWELNIC